MRGKGSKKNNEVTYKYSRRVRDISLALSSCPTRGTFHLYWPKKFACIKCDVDLCYSTFHILYVDGFVMNIEEQILITDEVARMVDLRWRRTLVDFKLESVKFFRLGCRETGQFGHLCCVSIESPTICTIRRELGLGEISEDYSCHFSVAERFVAF